MASSKPYPDAFSASKKHKIKIIYGMECYILDDGVPIVVGAKEQTLDDSYVVFDIETTGLSSEKDCITEIGAVKVINSHIVDTFSTFVNPKIPIPPKINSVNGYNIRNGSGCTTY